jgi:predicted amidohydrolase YtcJ
VGYHESVAGELDRSHLDRLVREQPLRIQHRSGALWMLNSRAVDLLGLDREDDLPGIERDRAGRATGRLFRRDDWLRARLDRANPPNLSDVSLRLASFGVTGLTDATARNSQDELREFVTAVERGELRQRVILMGGADLPTCRHPMIQRGALKVLLDEKNLPGFEELRGVIESAHQRGRPAAIHCVTRSELVLSAAAFEAAGCLPGDRIEHASVTPPDALELLTGLPITVVTQPGFIRERGDAYLVDVDPQEQPWLYRCRGFLCASIALGGSTDAPFGDPDPWRAMRSAVERRTETGQVIGPEEALTPEQALSLFTAPPQQPGGPPRPLSVGAPADLCLLDRSWARARSDLSSQRVVATIVAGSLIWARADLTARASGAGHTDESS